MAKNIKVIMELDTRDFDRGVSKVDGKLDKLESSASQRPVLVLSRWVPL